MTEYVKSNILQITPTTIQEVRKVYDLDKPGAMEQSVDILHDWIQKQEHFLKKDFRREYLERIIICSKGSVEKAKKRIDKVCTMRSMVPSLFQKCDAKNDFPNLQDWYINLYMPVITEENYRIFIAKMNNKPFTASHFLEGYQYSVVLSEYMKLYDYTIGCHVICDMREVNITDIGTKMDFVDLRNVMTLYTDGYGVSIKDICVLSNSSMVGVFVELLRKTVTAKISQRIYVCKTVEALYERLPRHLLPEDYGGDQKSILTLYNEWTEELSLDHNVAYMKDIKAAGTNEDLRHPDKFNEECLGMPGSFKRLEVD